MMTEVYLLAATKLCDGFSDYLNDLNITNWVNPCNTDPDLLVEMAGRLCYRSWAPYDPDAENAEHLNANVNKIREGNANYIKNILSSGHGSVLEHVNFTFLLRNVSRVLTHELVRHRAGMAYSQESLRYCRLERLTVFIPDDALPNTVQGEEARELIENAADVARCTIAKLNRLLLDNAPDFATKKAMTSLIRRVAPIGLSTNIIFTANARALRHIIQQRTSEHAELEIRQVFQKVADICIREAPHIFQDFRINAKLEYSFDSPKV